MSSQTESNVNTITDADLAAIAAEMGMSVADLKAPPRTTFKHDFGYHLQVQSVELTTSTGKATAGAQQLELSVVAIDASGKPNMKAKSKMWVTVPVENANFKFKDVDARERAISDFGTLARAAGLAPDNIKVVEIGGRKSYYDANENVLKGDALEQAFLASRVGVMKAALAVSKGSVEGFKNAKFYGVWNVNEYEGKTFRRFQSLSTSPISKKSYILDSKEMLAREGGSDDVAPTSDLF